MKAFLICGDGTIVLHVNDRLFNVPNTHLNYQDIILELKKPDCNDDRLVELADVKTAVSNYSHGLVEIKGDKVYYDGEELHGVLIARIVQFFDEGYNFEPMIKFLNNLMQNPSRRAIQELYSFLEHKHLPITEDGCFLAYKNVKQDLTDWRTGKVDNTPGAINEMPRRAVDDDATVACSYGYHVGAIEYVQSFHRDNSRHLLVKVNPADVVSIPHDCSCQKARVCRYEVLKEMPELAGVNKPVTDSVGNEYVNYNDAAFDDDTLWLDVDDGLSESYYWTLLRDDGSW